MLNKKVILGWLNKAQEDFDFASANLRDITNTFYSQICFHFQQSAEKYLKLYIIDHELEFKKIHDLIELLRICQNHNQKFQDLKDECKLLTVFYIDTRYPVYWPVDITKEDAEKAKISAEKIGSYVKMLLKDSLT